MRRALASVLATVLTLFAAAANAADIKVISAGAVRALIADMIDDYSKQTGHKFDFTTGPTGFLRDVIATGKHADLIIASAPLMGELEKTGKLTAAPISAASAWVSSSVKALRCRMSQRPRRSSSCCSRHPRSPIPTPSSA